MRSQTSLAGAVVGLLLVGGGVFAQDVVTPIACPPWCNPPSIPSGAMIPICPGIPTPGVTPPGVIPPGVEPQPGIQPGVPTAETADAFAQPGAGGTQAAAMFNPNMFGDFPPAQLVRGNFTATLPNGQVVVLQRGQTVPLSVQQPGTKFNFDIFQGNVVVLPAGTPIPHGGLSTPIQGILPFQTGSAGLQAIAAHGAFKITENESPRPQDRIFGTFNFFDNVGGSANAAAGLPQTNIYREVMGFEKTFLNGDASFGLRVPYLQVTGDGSLSRDDFGDISLVFKYAFINNRENGNLLSGGLVLTVPTGNSFLANDLPDVHSTVFQPFVGWIIHVSRDFYAQGFTSIAVPTDNRDVTYLFNDLGLGYTVWRSEDGDRLLTGVTPIFEFHLNTPLNHRGSQVDPIGGVDVLDLTAGVTLGIGRRSSLNLGVVTPVTGPKPFDVEAQVQFNWRF